jgi:hypothetical protein
VAIGWRLGVAKYIFQRQLSVAVVGGGLLREGCGIWVVGAAYRAAAPKLWKAAINSCWFAQASLIASFTRRTLTVTAAPIFGSLSRIVLAQARASAVPSSPTRRSACIST